MAKKQPSPLIPIINPGDDPVIVGHLEFVCRYIQNIDPAHTRCGLDTLAVVEEIEWCANDLKIKIIAGMEERAKRWKAAKGAAR